MNKRTIQSLVLITLATAFINIYGRFFIMPSILKAVVSLFLWIGVFLLPNKKSKYFSGKINVLIMGLILYSLAQLVRSIYFIDEIRTEGNNWLTLFGSDVMAQVLIVPLFIYYAHSPLILKYIRIALLALLTLIVIISIPQGNFFPYTIAFAISFFYYQKTKTDKLAILVLIVFGLLAGFTSDRIFILTTLVGIGALYLPRLLSSNIFKILVLSIFLLPMVLITYSLKNEMSIFEIGLNKIEDDEMSVDTRTFLYMELFDDLQKNDAIWFGKGALSGYQSDYFETNEETIGRTSNEVYFLHLILKGGVVYLFFIQLMMFLAILNAFKKGNNQLSKSFAFTIAGFSCLSFIGDFIGANMLHITIWLMIGFCLSKYWTLLTDRQLIYLIYKK